jgi:hypothetical protein
MAKISLEIQSKILDNNQLARTLKGPNRSGGRPCSGKDWRRSVWCLVHAHTANHVDRVANIDDDLRPGCDLDIDKLDTRYAPKRHSIKG